VYRYIDKKTFLDWGLTSDWTVEGPRKRARRLSFEEDARGTEGEKITTPSKGKKRDADVRDGAIEDENAASEGYGEMTEGSIERLLLLLRELTSAELDAPLPLRTPEKGQTIAEAREANGIDLSEKSTFIDIGSGYGKVVFHAALTARVAKSVGVEYVPSRAQKASEVQAELLSGSKATSFMTSDACVLVSPSRCELEQGDATTWGAFKFSHIYMYDRVFNEKTLALLAKQFNRSNFKVMVTYQRVELWRRLGLRNVSHVHSFTMRTTGGQNFKAYILVKDA
jgi:SAM-dependent methyltransferase